MNVRGVRCLLIALAMVPLTGALDARGQNFPERPIRFIVPYPPGGSTDILARLHAPG